MIWDVCDSREPTDFFVSFIIKYKLSTILFLLCFTYSLNSKSFWYFLYWLFHLFSFQDLLNSFLLKVSRRGVQSCVYPGIFVLPNSGILLQHITIAFIMSKTCRKMFSDKRLISYELKVSVNMPTYLKLYFLKTSIYYIGL